MTIAVIASIVSLGQLTVVGYFFRELFEALIACTALTKGKRNENYQWVVWPGAALGLAAAFSLGIWLRDKDTGWNHSWHSLAGSLALIMPFLLLGLAAWHLLPKALHHHMMPFRGWIYRLTKDRSRIWVMSGVGLMAFLVVIREGVEFIFLSLTQGNGRIIIAMVFGAVVVTGIWLAISSRLKKYLDHLNILLIASGGYMIATAGEAVVTDAGWPPILLHAFQLIYLALALAVLGWKFKPKKSHTVANQPMRDHVSV